LSENAWFKKKLILALQVTFLKRVLPITGRDKNLLMRAEVFLLGLLRLSKPVGEIITRDLNEVSIVASAANSDVRDNAMISDFNPITFS